MEKADFFLFDIFICGCLCEALKLLKYTQNTQGTLM